MLTLPKPIIAVIGPFAPLFSRSVFRYALVLLVGSILTPGRRTVTAALRVMGLSDLPHFQNYHRVFNRAKWSPTGIAQRLLSALVEAFVPDGPVVIGVDETLERRRGDKIKKKGIYRDSARSSKSFFVKSSALRWIVMMLLAPVPWAGRVWALPFLSVLAPSERYNKRKGKRHKTVTDWAEQMVARVRRWLPERPIVVVGDSTYAAIKFLDRCRRLKPAVAVVTRLRLDAGLYEPAPEPEPEKKKRGRPRKKGTRLPNLSQALCDPRTTWTTITVPRWYSLGPRQVEIVSRTCVWYHPGEPVVPIRWVLIRDPDGRLKPQALLCTDLDATPERIICWFVQRWQLETTFQEVRTHLGVETQRQWNDQAIDRETPALMGLFSLVTLLAKPYVEQAGIIVRRAAWYAKNSATFTDTLALVRYHLWRETNFAMSHDKRDVKKLEARLLDRMTETLCYTT